MRENQLLDWLHARYGSDPRLAVGIGDDAAVLTDSPGLQTVVATDLICDGTHFLSDQCSPEQIGRKAMAVNLSDLAAMAAKPTAAFVSLLLPKTWDAQATQRLMQGAAELADQFDCAIAGGDTNVWAYPLAVNVAVMGQVPQGQAILRSGALPGDWLLATGQLGGSLAGHHLDFTPRVNEALYLRRHHTVHAMMDLSDGLSMDLRRMGQASGCGATVYAGQIPIAAAARHEDKQRELRSAMTDGEDFELLISVPPEEGKRLIESQPLSTPLSHVGECTGDLEFTLRTAAGTAPLPQGGYEHETDSDDRRTE